MDIKNRVSSLELALTAPLKTAIADNCTHWGVSGRRVAAPDVSRRRVFQGARQRAARKPQVGEESQRDDDAGRRGATLAAGSKGPSTSSPPLCSGTFKSFHNEPNRMDFSSWSRLACNLVPVFFSFLAESSPKGLEASNGRG